MDATNTPQALVPRSPRRAQIMIRQLDASPFASQVACPLHNLSRKARDTDVGSSHLMKRGVPLSHEARSNVSNAACSWLQERQSLVVVANTCGTLRRLDVEEER